MFGDIKMWSDTSDVNAFIENYYLDSDGAISMQLCDYKRS